MDQYLKVKKAIEYIADNKLAGASLEEISEHMGLSRGHLQKLFSAWAGITPKQFSRYLSLQYAKELLANRTMLSAATSSGLSSGGRLHDLFVDIEAMTPGEYRDGGSGLEILYSTFPTRFGMCIVASTSRGICNILFADTREEAVDHLRAKWPNARSIAKPDSSHAVIKDYLSGISSKKKIKLHLKGTNFQLKVWEALLMISEGEFSTYGDIAGKIGVQKGVRAVGTAIGDNPVGFLIPCHRVLRSTGEIGGYRWGIERKRAMIGYEALRKNQL